MTQTSVSGTGLGPTVAARQPLWFQSKHTRERIWLGCVYVVLLSGALAMILPAYWLVVTSLKHENQVFEYPPRFYPKPATLINYIYGLSGIKKEMDYSEHDEDIYERGWVPVYEDSILPLYFRNTLVPIVVNTLGVSLSALTAYALARMRFRGRNAVFWTVVCVMLMPGAALLIPLYVTYQKLGWVNTFLPLTVPYCLGDSWMIFFLHQYFKTIPPELEDAAFIDGCGPFRIWWRIFLPLSKPALIVCALRVFLYWWNEFFEPLLYLQKRALWTLQLGVILYADWHHQLWGINMAYAATLAVPPVIVFFLAQKAFLRGIVFTGVRK